MDFELSDDQQALRDAARELLDDLAGPTQVRATAGGPDGAGQSPYDERLWSSMVEQGWTGLLLPEDAGGLGFGVVEAAVLLEEVGRHVAPAPFLQSLLALQAISSADAPGAAEAADRWVPALLAGESIGTVAWSPRVGVRASRESGGFRLDGRTDPTIYAPVADVLVVVATVPDSVEDGPLGLFAVDATTLGSMRPKAEAAMDQTRQLGWIHLDGVTAVRLGGTAAVERLTDLGATGTSAELLGGAEVAMQMAVDYAKERVQFDKPIGSFQAIKHKCADMLVDVEGMRSAVFYAAWAVGAGAEDASLSASTAKIWSSEAARRVMASALQVHGGIGFTWEHDLHLYLKRSQLDQVSFGDAAHHRSRLTGLLRPKVEAGESVI
jgi:alkylation response protein AidB-like acyl-CoA dehydrogenase